MCIKHVNTTVKLTWFTNVTKIVMAKWSIKALTSETYLNESYLTICRYPNHTQSIESCSSYLKLDIIRAHVTHTLSLWKVLLIDLNCCCINFHSFSFKHYARFWQFCHAVIYWLLIIYILIHVFLIQIWTLLFW